MKPQKLIKVKNKSLFLKSMKRKNARDKAFFGNKTENMVQLCLLKDCIVTRDFGPSDINKKFLESYINSGYLTRGNLQIKANMGNSVDTADLFYFLESN